MNKLKTLKLDFALSSIGLIALSSLPELQLFHQNLFIRKQSDFNESYFSEKDLYQFLQIHFCRKLHHYEVYIPCMSKESVYLPLSQGFVDRLTQDLGLSLFMEKRRIGTSMPGIVDVTELRIRRPNHSTKSKLIHIGYF